MFDAKTEINRVLADVFEGTTPDAEGSIVIAQDDNHLDVRARVYGRTLVQWSSDNDGDVNVQTITADTNVGAIDCFKAVLEAWREKASLSFLFGVDPSNIVITSTLDDAPQDDAVTVDAPDGWAVV